MPVSRFHDLRFQPHPNFPGAPEVFERMRTAPKFVFSRDVIDWLSEHSDDYTHAVAAAIGAGRTALPYSMMLVESEEGSERSFWLIKEVAPNNYNIFWAVHAPGASRDFVLDRPFPATFKPNGEAFVQSPRPSTAIIDSYRPAAGIALCLAMTLHVRGIITRPPAPIDPKLDTARIKRGKPPITKDFRTVHIGYVADRHGKEHPYAEGRGHVRPHVRAGHFKNQPCGPGGLDRKKIWIDAYLVNYGPDTSTAPPPQYLVVP